MQLYVKEVLLGGVDQVSKLAEEGNLKGQLAQAAGVDAGANGSNTTAAAAGGGKSVQERCKELIKRCVLCSETLNGAPDVTLSPLNGGGMAALPHVC